mgnify:FL=1
MECEPYQWALNLVDPKYSKSINVVSSNTLPSPNGYKAAQKSGGSSTVQKKHIGAKEKSKQISELQLQKAWRIAFEPAKAIPMNFFMSYMSGTSLQIIPIMTALMLLSGPIKAIFGVKKAFNPIMGNSEIRGQVYMAMLVFIVCQCGLMYIGIRKLN